MIYLPIVQIPIYSMAGAYKPGLAQLTELSGPGLVVAGHPSSPWIWC